MHNKRKSIIFLLACAQITFFNPCPLCLSLPKNKKTPFFIGETEPFQPIITPSKEATLQDRPSVENAEHSTTTGYDSPKR